MKHMVKFTDALQGTVTIPENKRKYFRTKDASSKSGHAIVAKIGMTHSGIVTKNYGFYLPSRMKDGASSFTKDFNKPVIIGHDENPLEQADPVGRVIAADYIDTSGQFIQRDSYLKSLYAVQDRKRKSNDVLDFVHHIIDTYEGKDGYKGLGYIEGLLRITDEETIAKILDERYLTVSTSMMSDSATCSVCGTDWVADGRCEHHRGVVYEDKVCVVIPGAMEYDHLGIVNAPADPHAHTFVVVNKYKDSYEIPEDKELFRYNDGIELAASLFAYKDSELVSLSAKDDVNLIQVKDNIQKMENAMAKKIKTQDKSLEQKVTDAVSISMRAFRYGEEGSDDMSVEVSQYMQEATPEKAKQLASKVMSLLDSVDGDITAEIIDAKLGEWLDSQHELLKHKDSANQKVDETFLSIWTDAKPKEDEEETEEGQEEDQNKGYSGPVDPKKKKKKKKTMSDSFKLVEGDDIDEELVKTTLDEIKEVELTDSQKQVVAEAWALKQAGDFVAGVLYADCENATDLATKYKDSLEYAVLVDLKIEDFNQMMNEHLADDAKITDETTFKTSDYCGVKGFFPVVDQATYDASLKVLKSLQMADSIRERILCSMEKKASKLGLTKTFDSKKNPCDNKPGASVEEMLTQYNDLRSKLIESGHVFDNDAAIRDSEQEIEILESQLEAANEDLDVLEGKVSKLTDALVEQYAIRLVDLKILSGNYEIADRVKEIETHKERTVESLQDSVKDLEAQVDIAGLKLNDGLVRNPEGQAQDSVVNPVLDPESKIKDSKTTTTTEDKKGLQKVDIYDTYRVKCIRYGKPEADRWLKSIQKKNNLISTLD